MNPARFRPPRRPCAAVQTAPSATAPGLIKEDAGPEGPTSENSINTSLDLVEKSRSDANTSGMEADTAYCNEHAADANNPTVEPFCAAEAAIQHLPASPSEATHNGGRGVDAIHDALFPLLSMLSEEDAFAIAWAAEGLRDAIRPVPKENRSAFLLNLIEVVA